jgi:hypothetical protein
MTAFLPFYKELPEVYLCEVEQENNKLKNHIEQLEFILDYEKGMLLESERKEVGCEKECSTKR